MQRRMRFRMIVFICFIVAMMAVFDAIDICIMLRNGIDLDYFRMVHPGGGVGDMLRAEAEKEN